jgi:hypothetical protein
MSTTLTPPAATPAPASDPTPRPPRSSARIVAIVAIVLGAVLIAGTLVFGVLRAVASSATGPAETYTADASGATGIDADLSAASFTVVFTDTDEATLEVSGGSWSNTGWTLERDGDQLMVRSPHRFFGWWIGGDERAVLELPAALAGSEFAGDFSVSAGSFRAEGDFGRLALDLAAGDLTVTGSAQELRTDVSAGSAVVELEGVRGADLSVSAGDADVLLTGTAPDRIGIDVSAGSLDLTVPDAAYRVSSDVSAGDLDNRLDTASGADREVTVSVSAGDVTLRPSSR